MTSSGWTDRMTRLNELLAELYPDQDVARQVITKAGLPTSTIRFHPAAGTNWFNILEEAHRRTRVDAIVNVARTEFPERREWAALDDTARHSGPDANAGSTAVGRDNAGRPLDVVSRKQLHRAFLAAFPSEGDLRRMIGLGMGENLATIAQGNLTNLVFEVVQWAESSGRLDELIAAASETNPDNPQLSAFVQSRRG